jgi:hypothetical protein
MGKKTDPILGWDVELTKTPTGRPILRAVDPEGGRLDYIEASHDETENGILVAREATERAILRERLRKATTEQEREHAHGNLAKFAERLEVIRNVRARFAILER